RALCGRSTHAIFHTHVQVLREIVEVLLSYVVVKSLVYMWNLFMEGSYSSRLL
ncbi:hypothetical protein PROFUN_15129, partial [Planoprotostelium fungivorum]